MKKYMSFYKKLIISYTITNVLIVLIFAGAIGAMKGMIGSDNPISYYKQFIGFAIVLGVIVVVCQAIFTTYSSRTIRVTMGTVLDATKKLAMGDTDMVLEKTNNDEFGLLVDDLNALIEHTKEQAAIADAVAGGDMTINVVPKSDKDVLGYALKTMVEKNYHALTNIDQGAYQVMTSASQVASASESLAQGSTEQASAIEQVTASIEEVAEKTKENADEANKAAALIEKVIADVQSGNAEMAQMLEAMNDINKSSESISKIIKVIDDIAFQTNILALNAAVEAARAGDAGKGFAVVAEEVRNLAAKSAQAAAETADLIEDSIEKVGVGSNIANDTYKSLEVITDVVRESESIITGVAESSNYQATAVAQINQAIGQISQVVQTNSATSEECAAASDELSGQAGRMRELISIFKLGNKPDNSVSREIDRKASPARVNNEKIISLGEDFGKY